MKIGHHQGQPNSARAAGEKSGRSGKPAMQPTPETQTVVKNFSSRQEMAKELLNISLISVNISKDYRYLEYVFGGEVFKELEQSELPLMALN